MTRTEKNRRGESSARALIIWGILNRYLGHEENVTIKEYEFRAEREKVTETFVELQYYTEETIPDPLEGYRESAIKERVGFTRQDMAAKIFEDLSRVIKIPDGVIAISGKYKGHKPMEINFIYQACDIELIEDAM